MRQNGLLVEPRGSRPLSGARGCVIKPVQRPSHAEGPSEIGDLVEKASGRRRRDDAAQVRRALSGGQPLDGAEIGSSRHADIAVGPGLQGDPLDGVVSVLPLAEVEVEIPVRIAPSPHILKRDCVAVADEVFQPVALELRSLEVRGADEDGGESADGVRQPDIGGELDTVPHRDAAVEVRARLGLKDPRCRQGGHRRREDPAPPAHRSLPPSVMGISTDSPQMWRANHSQLCHIAASRSRGFVIPWPKPL